MNNWMNEKNIEEIIIRLRDLNNDENEKTYQAQKNLFRKKLPLLLNDIRKLRQNAIDIFKFGTNLLNSLVTILAIEAEIISIINVAVFEQFEEKSEISIYIKKNNLYAYDDYLNTVSYYARDLQSISFLAQFYIHYVDKKESFL